jgi:hypothetical protein
MKHSVSKFMRELQAGGFTMTATGKGHWKITHPDMEGPVYAASSPSCPRASKNLRAEIKRKMRHGQTQP